MLHCKLPLPPTLLRSGCAACDRRQLQVAATLLPFSCVSARTTKAVVCECTNYKSSKSSKSTFSAFSRQLRTCLSLNPRSSQQSFAPADCSAEHLQKDILVRRILQGGVRGGCLVQRYFRCLRCRELARSSSGVSMCAFVLVKQVN
jgi:hypothetical protein